MHRQAQVHCTQRYVVCVEEDKPDLDGTGVGHLKGQSRMSGDLLHLSVPQSLETGSLIAPGSGLMPASPRNPVSAPPQCWDFQQGPGHANVAFYMGAGDVNKSLHACKRSALTHWTISPVPNFVFNLLSYFRYGKPSRTALIRVFWLGVW